MPIQSETLGAGGNPIMIEVTRLNGISMMVNSDLIKIAESSPDTMLTLIHGEKLIIRESCEEVFEKVIAYRASLLACVATRLKPYENLNRVVALTSLGPDDGLEDVVHVVQHNTHSQSGPGGQFGQFGQLG